MKRKLLSLTLAALMVLTLFAGCAASGDAGTSVTTAAGTSAATAKTTAAATTAAATTAASTSAAATTAAAPAGDTTLRFMWWGGETRHKATVAAMELYMKNNPGVKVECEYSGWDGYFDKLLTQLAGNNAPDIVQMSYTNVGEYVVRGQLQPLDEYMTSGVLNTDKLNKTLLSTYNIDGSYYAVPAGINTLLLYYNKTMLDELGIEYPATGMTMDQYMDKARAITDAARAKGKDDVWGMAMYGGQFDIEFQRTLIDNGGQMWSDDLSKANFNTAEGLATLKYLNLPLEEGFAPPPEVTASNPQGVDDFASGRVGMIITNATSAAGYASTAQFEMGMALAPFGNNKKVIWYQASQVFTVTKQSKNPAESAKVINFMVNDAEAGKLLAFERGIPANEDIRAASAEGKTDIEKLQLQLVSDAGQYTGDGVPMPFPAGYLEVHTEYTRLREAYIYGQATAEQTLIDLESFANKTIAKFVK